MGRKRKWLNDAERKQAERADKRTRLHTIGSQRQSVARRREVSLDVIQSVTDRQLAREWMDLRARGNSGHATIRTQLEPPLQLA